jgi:hypothetical protein
VIAHKMVIAQQLAAAAAVPQEGHHRAFAAHSITHQQNCSALARVSASAMDGMAPKEEPIHSWAEPETRPTHVAVSPAHSIPIVDDSQPWREHTSRSSSRK